jgi:hypothetical protein
MDEPAGSVVFDGQNLCRARPAAQIIEDAQKVV